jgi:hypothetical protein
MKSQIWVPIASTGLAGVLLLAGLQHADSEAYLFPNLLAGVLVIVGLLMLLTEGFQTSEDVKPSGFNFEVFIKIVPALLIFVAYLLLAEMLGFFATSFLAFVAIGTLYSPEDSVFRAIGLCVISALVFFTVLYVVFVLLLKVQLPAGLLM